MKTIKNLSYSALLLGTLAFATGCDKTSVEPQAPSASVQNDSRVRGIETRVTGHTASGKYFEATLRVSAFKYEDGQMKATAQMEQIGGGLSRTEVAALGAAELNFVVAVPNKDAYIYNPSALLITDSFTFAIAQAGYTAAGSQEVTLSQAYSYNLNADTRKWNLISGTVAEIVGLYDPATTATVTVDGVVLSGPTREDGGLSVVGIATQANKLNSIATIVGRF